MLALGVQRSDSVIHIYVYMSIFFFSILSHYTCQAPLSMGSPRQEYWSGLPFPSPQDIPDPGIKPRSPTLQVDSLPSEPPGKPYSLLQDIEYSSLYYVAKSCHLSILYIVLCMLIRCSQFIPSPTFYFGDHVCFLYL